MLEINRVRTPLAVPLLTGLSMALWHPVGAHSRQAEMLASASVLNRPATTRPSALSQPDAEMDWSAQWRPEVGEEAGMETFMRPPDVHEVRRSGRVMREVVAPPIWEF
jgi:hypothetical protein